MTNAFREYQGNLKKLFDSETIYHRFGFMEGVCDQQYIVESLENLERYIIDKFDVKKFESQRGFRLIIRDDSNQSLNLLDKSVNVPFAFSWKEPSTDTLGQIKELESRGIKTYDLRNLQDFELLKHYFQIELKRTKEMLKSLVNYNDPFPITLPFYKCACWSCCVEKIKEPDIFFWQYSLEKNKLVPIAYFSPQTYSMFMMFYLHFFILFSERLSTREHKSKIKRYRLRDHLKQCFFCNDFFIGPKSISVDMNTNKIKVSEFPCCHLENCLKQYDVKQSSKSQKGST